MLRPLTTHGTMLAVALAVTTLVGACGGSATTETRPTEAPSAEPGPAIGTREVTFDVQPEALTPPPLVRTVYSDEEVVAWLQRALPILEAKTVAAYADDALGRDVRAQWELEPTGAVTVDVSAAPPYPIAATRALEAALKAIAPDRAPPFTIAMALRVRLGEGAPRGAKLLPRVRAPEERAMDILKAAPLSAAFEVLQHWAGPEGEGGRTMSWMQSRVVPEGAVPPPPLGTPAAELLASSGWSNLALALLSAGGTLLTRYPVALMADGRPGAAFRSIAPLYALTKPQTAQDALTRRAIRRLAAFRELEEAALGAQAADVDPAERLARAEAVLRECPACPLALQARAAAHLSLRSPRAAEFLDDAAGMDPLPRAATRGATELPRAWRFPAARLGDATSLLKDPGTIDEDLGHLAVAAYDVATPASEQLAAWLWLLIAWSEPLVADAPWILESEREASEGADDIDVEGAAVRRHRALLGQLGLADDLPSKEKALGRTLRSRRKARRKAWRP